MTTPVPWFCFGRRLRRARALPLLCGLLTPLLAAAADAQHRFDIPPGDAIVTLRQAAQQGGVEIMFPAEVVRGLQTQAVHGAMSTRAALDQMLAGTDLTVVQDEKTRAYAVRRGAPPAPEEKPAPARALPSAAAPPDAPSVAATPAERGRLPTSKETVVVMSPFEVNTSRDQGYFASSSLSGTRLNSKLEDLASSISVITKQQLNDTAAIDINDIFMYEANTAGTYQYTDFTIDRTFYNENTTLNPQSANRIRGLSSANIAVNNFAASSSIPIDTYNVDSVEISRGPNANIFGLGNASGTVNLITSQANLTRDVNEIVLRGDSYGGWRTSLDLSRVLIKDRLAIKFAAVHDDKGFERRPAYESVNRQTAAFTVKPFPKTTIRGSYESYSDHYSRANTTLPRDAITEWMANGRPVWNPIAGASGGWRLLNGSTYTGVTTANESAALPLGLIPGGTGFWANPSVFIEGDGRASFYGMNGASSTLTAPNTASSPIYRYGQTGSIYIRGKDITQNPAVPLILYQPLSIANKSIYDYTKTNFLSPNFGHDGADIYEAEVEQWILETPRHSVALQFGYRREVLDRYDHSVFSRSDSGTPYVSVDVNEVLLDGTPNPYFLRPYLGASQPDIKFADERNGDGRATLAYQLDLTNEPGWVRWLGHHNFALYGERQDLLTTSLAARDINISNYSWSTANDLGSLPLRGNTYRIFPRYYVGGPVTAPGPVFDYAPASDFSLSGTPFTWYTSNRTAVNEGASISEVIQSGNSTKRQIRTQGVTWQGFFWKDRLVTTFGWRNDRNAQTLSRNLNDNLNATTTIDPNTHLNNLGWVRNFPNPWDKNAGDSRSAGVVFKAWPWLNLNYSQSNSFRPETFAYDINTNPLPNPTGKTRDYGFTFKLLDDKLYARVTRYESVEKNSRNGSITSAAVTRTLRLFFDPSSSNALVSATNGVFPNGMDAFDLEQAGAQWYLQQNPTATAAQAQQASVTTYLQPLGIDQAFIDRARQIGTSAFADVNTVTSTGVEVELTYNPSRYWTMKLAGAQQKAIDSELGDKINNFISSRLAAANAIVVPTTAITVANGTAGKQWWRVAGQTSSSSTDSPANFYVANVKSVIDLATANAGKPRAQTREYTANFTTNFRLGAISDQPWLQRTSVGGALHWESHAVQGYYGAAPSTDPSYSGAIVDYDPKRPIYDKARAEIDLMLSHDLKLWGRVRCRLQLNVRNALENGRLQAIGYNPDGTAWNYRIIDPRQFILSATFDF